MKAISQNIKNKAHIWYNLAYVIAGAATGSLELFFAFSMLGASSWMAHLKGGDWWYYDWAGMYTSFLAIILYNFGVGYVIFPLVPLIYWLTVKKVKESNYLLLGTIWVGAVFSAWMAGVTLWPALIVFGIGLALRQVEPDITKPRYNFFHKLWHLFTAYGKYLLVR